MTEIRTSVGVPFSEIYRAIVNAANPAPYLRDGMSEWLHFRVVAAATPRVKTTHVSFRSRLPLLRYASFKYTHFLMREVGPFLISAHICLPCWFLFGFFLRFFSLYAVFPQVFSLGGFVF